MYQPGTSKFGISLGYEIGGKSKANSKDANDGARANMICDLAYLHNAQFAIQLSARDCLLAGMPPEALINMVRELCVNSREHCVLLADD